MTESLKDSYHMDISELLRFVVESKGSDLHISSGEMPIIRVNGEMTRIDLPPLTKEDVHKMIYDLLTDIQKQIFEETLELDFSFNLGDFARFRVNVFRQQRGESAVFRTIPGKIPTFQDLRLPPVFKQIALMEKGLVLVTGPTGSGKSTTLAAIIDFINNLKREHIITIEDPIEFLHVSKKCLINQRELGPHTKSFASALKSALREDPDVILVGEMRDLETISLALTAAETGHLVFATLHTNSAPDTIDRIIDVFPADKQNQVRSMFSASLQAVVSQRLFKRRDGMGRLAAFEVMIATAAVRNLIRENKIAQIISIIQTSKNIGMQTMEASCQELLKKNLVRRDELAFFINDSQG
ncbi:MAG: type IV pilus twitching motility protein PilT [Syntrophales bacterium]|nr:type IV pilus twitching motility protein PilT [Syntrophales bacterium]